METKCKTIKADNWIAFIDESCTITIDGKDFTSGGGYILQRADNRKWEAIVYAKPEMHEVTNWDGSIRIPAYFGNKYPHNFGGNIRHVWFTYKEINFHGKYCCDYSELARCYQVK